MNVQAVLEAYDSPAYKQWKSTSKHIAPWNEHEVINVIQSGIFQAWYRQNPNGTIDQFYRALQNQQQYYNSPEYRVQQLEGYNENLTNQIGSLSRENMNLRAEIKHKDKTVKTQEIIIGAVSSTSIILLIVVFVLVSKLRKIKRITSINKG